MTSPLPSLPPLLSSTYALQCPLNTSPLRHKILELFPEYLDYDSQERRIKSCRRSIEGVSKLLKEHSENAEVVEFLKEKLQIAIFQNPYPECFELFAQAYATHFKCEIDEENTDEASLFFPNATIPSIQKLGIALQEYINAENNKNECEGSTQDNNAQQLEQPKEDYGEQQPDFQSKSEQQKPQLKLSWPVIQNEVSNDDFQMILGDIFNTNLGRIPQLERMFCWFPDFLTKFHYAVQTIFQAPGPIPIDQRYFIAILASSNFGCEYLHSKLSQQYLDCGGSIELLEGGFEKADTKMQALAAFISQLAYQPFDIPKSPKMIQDLLDKGWQKNELVQSAFIISFYHGLSCICQALGLKSELDLKNSDINMQTKNQTPIGSNQQSPREKAKGANNGDRFGFNNQEIEKILSEMTVQQEEEQKAEDPETIKVQENVDGKQSPEVQLESTQQGKSSDNQMEGQQSTLSSFLDDQSQLEKSNDTTQQQQQQQQSQSASSQAHRKSLQDMLSPKDMITLNENDRQVKNMLERFTKFIANPTFSEERVARSLKQSEFTFSIHGVDMCNRYAAELSQAFGDLFEVVKTMTNRKQR